MKKKVSKNTTLSDETIALINCHRALQGFYTETVEALSLQMGDIKEAEKIIGGEFSDYYSQLRGVLEKYLLDSITQNIALQDVKQI